MPAGNPDGGQWTTGGGETSSNTEGEGRSGTPISANERVWERFPNADFRNRLAVAENGADKPNFGYTEVHQSRDGKSALGRYQMTQVGLQAAGMMDAQGTWTGKYGIHSAEQFLASPQAQERALTDLLDDTERQLRTYGLFNYIGTTINGLVDRFPVTGAGLIAAAHRYGAQGTRDYLRALGNSGFSSSRARLTVRDLAVETRLRTFADAPYE